MRWLALMIVTLSGCESGDGAAEVSEADDVSDAAISDARCVPDVRSIVTVEDVLQLQEGCPGLGYGVMSGYPCRTDGARCHYGCGEWHADRAYVVDAYCCDHVWVLENLRPACLH